MNCELSRSLLHGYLDGELDPVRAQEFEQHLENCSPCIAQLEAQETLRGSLRKANLYERAPESLTRKFRRQIASAESESDWSWRAFRTGRSRKGDAAKALGEHGAQQDQHAHGRPQSALAD